MKNRFTHKINFVAIVMAIASFSIGTLLMLTYKISDITYILSIGFYYTVFAYMANAFMLLIVLINLLLHHKEYKEHVAAIVILLVNIPISSWYIDLVL